jgi:hypothetical protein
MNPIKRLAPDGTTIRSGAGPVTRKTVIERRGLSEEKIPVHPASGLTLVAKSG